MHAPHGMMASLMVLLVVCAGDTQTRGHIAVAILSGCVPVLFDGELFPDMCREVTGVAYHPWCGVGPMYMNMTNVTELPSVNELLAPGTEVSWPWRHTGDFKLHYADFAVIFDAQDVVTGVVNPLEKLQQMPSHEYNRLCDGLGKVQKFFLYAPEVETIDALHAHLEVVCNYSPSHCANNAKQPLVV